MAREELIIKLNMLEQFGAQVLQIRQDQGLTGLGSQDLFGQGEQLDGRRGRRAGRGGGGEADRLMRVRVEGEEGRGHLERLGFMVVAIPAHLAFAVTAQAMGIDGQSAAGGPT